MSCLYRVGSALLSGVVAVNSKGSLLEAKVRLVQGRGVSSTQAGGPLSLGACLARRPFLAACEMFLRLVSLSSLSPARSFHSVSRYLGGGLETWLGGAIPEKWEVEWLVVE